MERRTDSAPMKLSSVEYEKIEIRVVKLYIDLNLTRIPINPFEVAKRLGYIVKRYSDMPNDTRRELKMYAEDGCSFFNPDLGTWVIFYDDCMPHVRIRFTIMHEIGHILLEHRHESELARKMADYFAAYALVPSPLMGYSKCEDFTEVADRFDVSTDCAYICFQRFMNWRMYGGNIKQYEIDLLDLFS